MKKITYNQLTTKKAPHKNGNGHISKNISLKRGGKNFKKALGATEVTKAQIAGQDNEHSYPVPVLTKEKTIKAINNVGLPIAIKKKITSKKKKLE